MEDADCNKPTDKCPASSELTAPAVPPNLEHQKFQPTVPTPALPKKIYSQNANGTVVTTTVPGNEAELQLYRVMQRASLLLYYDTLLEMGGDDVQQLCDAGEDEFLEIAALVGMAAKPLHVRRFQKALQDWMLDPSAFKLPLIAQQPSTTSTPPLQCNINQEVTVQQVVCCTKRSILEANRPMYSASPGGPLSKSSSRSTSPMDVPSCSSSCGSGMASSSAALSEAHITRLRASAERISKQLPQLEPRTPNAKRKGCKQLQHVLAMSEDEPRRMDEIRKYAAIYGRFDCKRKAEKPLTLHEAAVNEAAAQLCDLLPALLTRRDELFPLARQTVRDAGYFYAKATNLQWSCSRKSEDDEEDEDISEEEPARKKIVLFPS